MVAPTPNEVEFKLKNGGFYAFFPCAKAEYERFMQHYDAEIARLQVRTTKQPGA